MDEVSIINKFGYVVRWGFALPDEAQAYLLKIVYSMSVEGSEIFNIYSTFYDGDSKMFHAFYVFKAF
jgi:hypothetical protein